MPANLCPHAVSARRIASWWLAALDRASTGAAATAKIEVREDALFASGAWLDLGEVGLQLPGPGPQGNDDDGWSREDHLFAAIQGGGYRWTLPDAPAFEEALIQSVDGAVKNEQELRRAAPRARDAFAYALLRLGLEMPLLDAHDLAELPFQRPVTLVADTNAVLQGGVDFSVRFLYPMARLRVPETVHAELSSQASNYFSSRRQAQPEKIKAVNGLRQRLTSQGGLRALLRVQLQSGVEIERLQVEAEQTRHLDLVGGSGEKGDRTNLPDRMILETTLRHRALIAAGHPVRIMTSDQGLARSAMIEGISPLYFPSRRWETLFGRTYLGASFAPLRGAGKSMWHRVALTEILWELAVCFGSARLRLKNGASFTVTATGRELTWSPYHAREDSLWIESADVVDNSAPNTLSGEGQAPATGGDPVHPEPRATKKAKTRTVDKAVTPERPVPPARLVTPKFSIEKLMVFWHWLATQRGGTEKQVAKFLDFTPKNTGRYLALMSSGEFLKLEGNKVTVDSETFDPLWTALRGEQWNDLRQHLLRLPSFASLCGTLAAGVTKFEDVPHIPTSALLGYQRLGEICGAVLNIPGRGLCFCEPGPDLDDFSAKAVEAYAEALADDPSTKPLVRSGSWMETLAVKHRVHPLFAPALMQEAITAQRLRVVFEGSQPSREKANHIFHRVVWQKETPVAEEIALYRGTYLAKDRASVQMRIEESNQ